MARNIRPAVFMHIQKTAGTSIQEMARYVYGNDNVLSHADFAQRGLEGCRAVPFVSGHFGFAFAKALMRGRFSFTFLRDPYQRLISLYHFCRTRPPEEHPIYRVAQENDFLRFLEPVHGDDHWSMVWNNQATQLYSGRGAEMVGPAMERGWDLPPMRLAGAAKDNLLRFDHVGFQHTFREDAQAIFRALGVPRVFERRANVGVGNVGYADLPGEAQRRLQEITAIERDVYAHALEMRDQGGHRSRPLARFRRFRLR